MAITEAHFNRLVWIVYQYVRTYDELLDELDFGDRDYQRSRTAEISQDLRELHRIIRGNEPMYEEEI